jgi:hypothetical protein
VRQDEICRDGARGLPTGLDEGREVVVLQAALFIRDDPFKVEQPAGK